MKHLFIGSAALLALATACPASAADMPVTPPAYKAAPATMAAYDWSGFYLGVHGGWGFGNAEYNFLPIATFFAPSTGGSFSEHVDGGLFGVHRGVNFQTGNWVVGLEASLAWSRLKGSSISPLTPPFGAVTTFDTKLKWLATLTPRVGYAAGNWLFFVKAGMAAGQIESHLHTTLGGENFAEKENYLGWTVGIGGEYAWTPNWIVGIEYNYYDLGSQSFGGYPCLPSGSCGSTRTTSYSVDGRFSTVLARISYKWDNATRATFLGIPTKAPSATATLWSGIYIGVHGGWGWGDADEAFSTGGIPFLSPVIPASFTQRIDGGLFGGHLGINYQNGNWLVGLEGSFAWADMNGYSVNPLAAAGVDPPITYDTKLKWIATSTSRLGYVWSNWLLYAKGGLAAGQVESNLAGSQAINFSETNKHVGWIIGVGAEFAWTPGWILGVEYNYYDLGKQHYGGPGFNPGPVPALGVDYDIDLTFSTVLARLSYKFGDFGKGPVVTRY